MKHSLAEELPWIIGGAATSSSVVGLIAYFFFSIHCRQYRRRTAEGMLDQEQSSP
jgi:hypothetical protein